MNLIIWIFLRVGILLIEIGKKKLKTFFLFFQFHSIRLTLKN